MNFFEKYFAYRQDYLDTNLKSVIQGNYDHEKLITHAGKMGISEQDFINALRNNNRFAAYILAKDPNLSLIHI